MSILVETYTRSPSVAGVTLKPKPGGSVYSQIRFPVAASRAGVAGPTATIRRPFNNSGAPESGLITAR
jgi:hypothetical protein